MSLEKGSQLPQTNIFTGQEITTKKNRKTEYVTYGKKNPPLLSSEPANCRYYLQKQVETAPRGPDSCLETFQEAVVPSLSVNSTGPFILQKGKLRPRRRRPLQANGRSRTRPKGRQRLSNPTPTGHLPKGLRWEWGQWNSRQRNVNEGLFLQMALGALRKVSSGKFTKLLGAK